MWAKDDLEIITNISNALWVEQGVHRCLVHSISCYIYIISFCMYYYTCIYVINYWSLYLIKAVLILQWHMCMSICIRVWISVEGKKINKKNTSQEPIIILCWELVSMIKPILCIWCEKQRKSLMVFKSTAWFPSSLKSKLACKSKQTWDTLIWKQLYPHIHKDWHYFKVKWLISEVNVVFNNLVSDSWTMG